MLKIKDDVDLKELEKFGLYKQEVYFGYVYTNETLEIREKDKMFGTWDYLECTDLNIYNDTLYDLIKADLVEKVGDNNERIN